MKLLAALAMLVTISGNAVFAEQCGTDQKSSEARKAEAKKEEGDAKNQFSSQERTDSESSLRSDD